MKINTKKLSDSWDQLPKKYQIDQINHIINNCKKDIIHQVNKLLVFDFNGHYEVINTESLSVKFFDTEKECINYCLDVYPNTFISTQENLFN